MSLTIGVYPGYQEVSLEPGGTYEGSFFVVNTGEDGEEFIDYRILTTPFSVSEDGETMDYSTPSDRTRISEWITFDKKTGTIGPSTKQEIKYSIHVPEDAPVGGQYCALVARIDQATMSTEGIHVGAIYQVANIIYATVAGDLNYSGEIISSRIHPIFLDAKIQTSATVRNTGNVHTDAASIVRIYNIFNDEEIYSTEDGPMTSTIIPGTTKDIVSIWENSPQLGLFRVVQTVSIAGEIDTTSGIVFVAPLWFLIVWSAFILSCISWLIFRRRARRRIGKNSKSFTRPGVSR